MQPPPARAGFDLLPSLPVELAVRVTSRLPPLDLVRLRLVSKRWHALLISRDVCAASALRWLASDADIASRRLPGRFRSPPHPDSPSNSETENPDIPWRELFDNTLSRSLFFKRGEYAHSFRLNTGPVPDCLDLDPRDIRDSYAYCDGQRLLAWLTYQHNEHRRPKFCVQNLESGEFLYRNQQLPAGENPTQIVLLEGYVVLVPKGKACLYVYTLDTAGGEKEDDGKDSHGEMVRPVSTVPLLRQAGAHPEGFRLLLGHDANILVALLGRHSSVDMAIVYDVEKKTTHVLQQQPYLTLTALLPEYTWADSTALIVDASERTFTTLAVEDVRGNVHGMRGKLGICIRTKTFCFRSCTAGPASASGSAVSIRSHEETHFRISSSSPFPPITRCGPGLYRVAAFQTNWMHIDGVLVLLLYDACKRKVMRQVYRVPKATGQSKKLLLWEDTLVMDTIEHVLGTLLGKPEVMIKIRRHWAVTVPRSVDTLDDDILLAPDSTSVMGEGYRIVYGVKNRCNKLEGLLRKETGSIVRVKRIDSTRIDSTRSGWQDDGCEDQIFMLCGKRYMVTHRSGKGVYVNEFRGVFDTQPPGQRS